MKLLSKQSPRNVRISSVPVKVAGTHCGRLQHCGRLSHCGRVQESRRQPRKGVAR